LLPPDTFLSRRNAQKCVCGREPRLQRSLGPLAGNGEGPPEGGGKWRRREGRGEERMIGEGWGKWNGREGKGLPPERKSYSYGLGTRPVTAC